MKKKFFGILLATASFCLHGCNTETGTVHETPEGYGTGQRDPENSGEGGPTLDVNTTNSDPRNTTGSQTGEVDTMGTSATMETKREAGSSHTRGTPNTSKSETTKNVEVKKQ